MSPSSPLAKMSNTCTYLLSPLACPQARRLAPRAEAEALAHLVSSALQGSSPSPPPLLSATGSNLPSARLPSRGARPQSRPQDPLAQLAAAHHSSSSHSYQQQALGFGAGVGVEAGTGAGPAGGPLSAHYMHLAQRYPMLLLPEVMRGLGPGRSLSPPSAYSQSAMPSQQQSPYEAGATGQGRAGMAGGGAGQGVGHTILTHGVQRSPSPSPPRANGYAAQQQQQQQGLPTAQGSGYGPGFVGAMPPGSAGPQHHPQHAHAHRHHHFNLVRAGPLAPLVYDSGSPGLGPVLSVHGLGGGTLSPTREAADERESDGEQVQAHVRSASPQPPARQPPQQQPRAEASQSGRPMWAGAGASGGGYGGYGGGNYAAASAGVKEPAAQPHVAHHPHHHRHYHNHLHNHRNRHGGPEPDPHTAYHGVGGGPGGLLPSLLGMPLFSPTMWPFLPPEQEALLHEAILGMQSMYGPGSSHASPTPPHFVQPLVGHSYGSPSPPPGSQQRQPSNQQSGRQVVNGAGGSPISRQQQQQQQAGQGVGAMGPGGQGLSASWDASATSPQKHSPIVRSSSREQLGLVFHTNPSYLHRSLPTIPSKGHGQHLQAGVPGVGGLGGAGAGAGAGLGATGSSQGLTGTGTLQAQASQYQLASQPSATALGLTCMISPSGSAAQPGSAGAAGAGPLGSPASQVPALPAILPPTLPAQRGHGFKGSGAVSQSTSRRAAAAAANAAGGLSPLAVPPLDLRMGGGSPNPSPGATLAAAGLGSGAATAGSGQGVGPLEAEESWPAGLGQGQGQGLSREPSAGMVGWAAAGPLGAGPTPPTARQAQQQASAQFRKRRQSQPDELLHASGDKMGMGGLTNRHISPRGGSYVTVSGAAAGMNGGAGPGALHGSGLGAAAVHGKKVPPLVLQGMGSIGSQSQAVGVAALLGPGQQEVVRTVRTTYVVGEDGAMEVVERHSEEGGGVTSRRTSRKT